MDLLRKRKSFNIDLSNRCALQCPRCQREMFFRTKGLPVPGKDLSNTEFYQILYNAEFIRFCGQYSDPIHHPNFIDYLKLCKEYKVSVAVHTASTGKKESWYYDAFKANNEAIWLFGIDGLPESSHNYRINQKGNKLFKIMLNSKKYLKNTPIWQYIIFSYNENTIISANKIAQDNGITFVTMVSSRWLGENDSLKPLEKDNHLKIQ